MFVLQLLQFIADNGLSQHVQDPTSHNNILDLVITTEEALLVTLQIKDKIGDHQAIQFSLQTEKEETITEKTNYNFRMAEPWLRRVTPLALATRLLGNSQ